MKVYIVTEGSYSDYRILAAFLDKEKAERYAKTAGYHYEGSNVEKYELQDDTDFKEYTFAYIDCKVSEKNNEPEFAIRFSFWRQNSIDEKPEDAEYTRYFHMLRPKGISITMGRVITCESYDEEKLKLKYLKVCQDLYWQGKALLEQGYSNKQIEKMMSKGY